MGLEREQVSGICSGGGESWEGSGLSSRTVPGEAGFGRGDFVGAAAITAKARPIPGGGMGRGIYTERPGRAAGWVEEALLLLVGRGQGWAILLGGGLDNPVLLVQPAPQVNCPAAFGTERVIRIVLPVAGHGCVTDRAPHRFHRPRPAPTSRISPISCLLVTVHLLLLYGAACSSRFQQITGFRDPIPSQ